MSTTARHLRWLLLGMAFVLGLSLSACKPGEPPKPKGYGAGISGYNFTDEGVQEFFVNGQWASNLAPYVGGGVVCCIRLPEQWTSDLTVRVDWTIGHYTQLWERRKNMTIEEETVCCWTERTLSKVVPIQRYGKEGGGLQVFFLPNDEVEVWVSDWDLGAPQHPSGRTYPKRPPGVD